MALTFGLFGIKLSAWHRILELSLIPLFKKKLRLVRNPRFRVKPTQRYLQHSFRKSCQTIQNFNPNTPVKIVQKCSSKNTPAGAGSEIYQMYTQRRGP